MGTYLGEGGVGKDRICGKLSGAQPLRRITLPNYDYFFVFCCIFGRSKCHFFKKQCAPLPLRLVLNSYNTCVFSAICTFARKDWFWQ